MIYRRICIRTRNAVLFHTNMINSLAQCRLTRPLLQLISIKSIVCQGAWRVGSSLRSFHFPFLYRLMRRPLPIAFSMAEMSPHVIRAWTRRPVSLILAGIHKIDLIANVFGAICFFGPISLNAVFIGRRKSLFLLIHTNFIEVTLLVCSFVLMGSLFGPLKLLVSLILIFEVLLAGPGEQPYLMLWSK